MAPDCRERTSNRPCLLDVAANLFADARAERLLDKPLGDLNYGRAAHPATRRRFRQSEIFGTNGRWHDFNPLNF